jgi:hypothetical protein
MSQSTPNALSTTLLRSLGSIAGLATALALGIAIYGQPAPAQAAVAGWQGVVAFSYPQGQQTHFYEINCPAAFPVVVSGSYAFNSVGQASGVAVGFSGPRIDESPPQFNGWGWNFNFVNGAPAGVTVLLDINCQKRE